MDPAPTANPHAELVTECFQECPGLESPARSWSPPASLVKWSWWSVVGEPAVNDDEDRLREDKVGDVCCEEDNMSPSSWNWLPGLAGHGGEVIGQGQHTSAVENMSKLEVLRSCTLPSLKDLDLDIYVKKRN